jgi:hypothetical protein
MLDLCNPDCNIINEVFMTGSLNVGTAIPLGVTCVVTGHGTRDMGNGTWAMGHGIRDMIM